MNHQNNTNKDLSKTMKIISNKWTPLIIKELLDGPKKFCQLQTLTNNINPRTLTQKLANLEKEKIIEKIEISNCSSRKIYKLTKKGFDLQNIIKQMIDWGKKY